jgi:hypothetical protein
MGGEDAAGVPDQFLSSWRQRSATAGSCQQRLTDDVFQALHLRSYG